MLTSDRRAVASRGGVTHADGIEPPARRSSGRTLTPSCAAHRRASRAERGLFGGLTTLTACRTRAKLRSDRKGSPRMARNRPLHQAIEQV